MPGTLYVVATPIGNLEDVTLRALRILREVSLIAAEDTRRTARLLQHYSISTRTTSLHEHNERTRTPGLIARLEGGESIALVTDAGTPVVSDPGTHFVAAAHAAGIRVEPIPGASAILAALSASGLLRGEFLFAGFPPSRANARENWFASLAAETRTIVLYEAPHRIRATLQAMQAAFGDRIIAVARELTKTHEQLVVRPISYFTPDHLPERGEFTLVVSGAMPGAPAEMVPEPRAMAAEFGQMTTIGGKSRREALRSLAKKYGLPARDVFGFLEEAKRLAE
ncbi:MAG: 16S rRNA (cytidine(1402)-2'-O)-methyltransferase [Acidobacteriota bacterium]|nr:16S rRNA (cytidine(1402)-2'-O)-methyltransferase [Acidobacteriota bacterium]